METGILLRKWGRCMALVLSACLAMACWPGRAHAQVTVDWVNGIYENGDLLSWRCKVDRQGNMYTLGKYNKDITDFDPGPGVFQTPCSNRGSCFLEKLDSAGNFVWERSFIYTTGNNLVIFRKAVFELDSMGNSYIAMPAERSIDVDPGLAQQVCTVIGHDDLVLVKLDTAGNLVWGFDIGDTGFDTPSDIDVMPNGDFVVTGMFQNTIDFDPGPGATNLTSASTGGDIFMAKYTTNGALVWVRTLTSSGLHYPGCVALDANGNSYWGGVFSGTGDLDPGSGTVAVTASGLNDVYLIRLDTNGNYTGGIAWAGTYSQRAPRDLQVGPEPSLTIFLDLAGTQDLDPGPGTVMSPAPLGSNNKALVNLDTNFQYRWAWAITTPGGFSPMEEFAIDRAGNLFFSGLFNGTLDFDVGPAVHALTAGNALGSGFICELDSNGNYVNAWLIGGSENSEVTAVDVAADGKGYATGYSGLVCDFDPGTGVLGHGYSTDLSVFYWKWMACSPDTTYITAAACESYTSGAQTYTSSGDYVQQLANMRGCDSVVALHLTIWQPDSGSVVVVGCDSVQVNGQFYLSSGTYQQLLTNVHGCDSVLTIVVTLATLDTTVVVAGDSLMAAAGMATYQWLDCTTLLAPIPGEVFQSFSPPSTGQYAVIVGNGFCTDTSACHLWIVDGMAVGVGEGPTIAPSPTLGDVTVALPVGTTVCKYAVYDAMGSRVLQGEFTHPKTILSLPPVSGVYFLHLQSPDGPAWLRRVMRL